MKLKNLTEFGLIERISKIIGKPNQNVLIGIGDDSAVIRSKKDNLLVLTTDAMIEKVHFNLDYCSFYGIGWKAIASNISDCISMGATPTVALVTLGLPNYISVEEVEEIYCGAKALAKQNKIDIVGGDTVSSPKALMVSVTLIGEVVKKDLIRRKGARAGDAILVSGSLGKASKELQELKESMPVPRIKEAKLIVKSKAATSMMDNSDGLATCIKEICKMSSVGAEIWLKEIPVSQGATLNQAFYGGEGYELVFTMPFKKAKLISRKGNIKIIGIIKPKQAGINLVGLKGKKQKLIKTGYDHFRSK